MNNEAALLRRRRIAIAGLTALALLIVFAVVVVLSRGHSKHTDINNTLLGRVRSQTTPVQLATVSYGSISEHLRLTGQIQSSGTANVSASVAGIVQAVLVTEGSHVDAGQLLVQINPAQADAQVSQARQGLQAAQSQYEKALAARTVSYNQAAGDVAQARNALQQAEIGQAKANAGAGLPAIQQAQENAVAAHAAAREAADALTRTQYLFENGVVPRSTLEDVRTKATQAEANAAAADASVRQAQEGATPEDRALAASRVNEARQGLQQAENAQRSRQQIADADVAAALTQVHSAEDQLRLAQLQQAGTQVTSPLTGVVTAVRVHAGETAGPGAPLVSITSLGSVYFKTSVSDIEKQQLAVGQPATVTVSVLAGQSFSGKVSEIVPVINPGATGFDVRIGIQTHGVLVPPGAYGTAVVQIAAAAHTLVIPINAVLTDSDGTITGKTGQKYVYMIGAGNKAAPRPITVGLTSETQAEVVSGLQEGEQVITVGAELLQPNAAVTVQPAGGGA